MRFAVGRWIALACAGQALALAGQAQLVLSGNENKIDLTSGSAKAIPNAPPDTLTLLDFSTFPPRVDHVTNVANTVLGPPSNIAIAPGGQWALLANSARVDPSNPEVFPPETEIHVLDLSVRPPRVVSRAQAGRQPSGISIWPDGRHAVVANRADGTVSLLRLDWPRVETIQTVEVCRPEESVSDVAIHPDGELLLASAQKGGYLAVLKFESGHLKPTGRRISVYGQPYRCVITPDGELGLTAGQGLGNGLDADALTVVDLKASPMRAIDYVPLGAVPESFEVSPKGDLVAAVTMEGSNLGPENPLRTTEGALVLLSRKGKEWKLAQKIPVGAIPEGVAFTSDGKHLVVQCHPARELWVFEIRRGRARDTGLRIPTPGMPSSLRASL